MKAKKISFHAYRGFVNVFSVCLWLKKVSVLAENVRMLCVVEF